MKLCLKILFTMLFIKSISYCAEKSLDIPPVKGFVSNYDGVNLKSDFATDAQNIFFDKDLGPSKRFGFTRDNTVSLGSQTVSVLGQFVKSDGNEYLVAISSNILAYSIGLSSFTTIIATVNPRVPMDCLSALDKFICSSSTQAFFWTGEAKTVDVTTAPTAFPLGDFLAKHVNRVWVAGVKGNRSILYGSKFLDATTWTLGGNASDPVQFIIGINDGDVITAIYSFGDALIVFKRRSTWAILGKNQNNFEIKNLSNLIGCIQHKSVREKQGKLYWLSHRGIEKLEGGVISPFGSFSDPIKDWVDLIVSGYDVTSQRSVTDTTQNDFEIGVSTYISTTQSVGAIEISSPAVNFSTPTSQDMAAETQWDSVDSGAQGAIAMSFSPKFNTRVLEASVNLVQKDDGACGSSMKMNMYLSSGNTGGGLTVPSGVHISTGVNSNTEMPCGSIRDARYSSVYGDAFTNTENTVLRNTTYWLVLDATTIFAGQDRHLYTSSTNSFALAGTTTAITTTFNLKPVSWSFLGGNKNKFTVRLSSADFVSTVKDLGQSVKAVSFFNSNFNTDGGQVHFYSRGGASSDLGAVSWSPQGVGSTAAVNNGRFVQWKAEFGIFFSSQNPAIQDVTISWSDNTSKQNVASWVFDDQYWLSGSTGTDSEATNNTVIVVDRFDNFSKLNGINALSFAEAFDKRFFGISVSSGGESGIVNRFVEALTDNGKAIDAFFVTKDYCGDSCESQKSFSRLYIKTKNDTPSGGVLTAQYQFNRDGTSTSLGDVSLTEGTGFITSRVYFQYGPGGSQAKQARFRFGNNQADHDFRFYGAKVYYDEFPVE